MLPNDLLELLSCAVLEQELRSLLVFDFPFEALDEAGEVASAMLGRHLGRPVKTIMLGSTDTEDDVWGFRRDWMGELGNLSALLPPGSLGSALRERVFPLVIVHDLASLSLSASRAAVTWLGAPHIVLQRHGESEVYSTEGLWLAQCASGNLSGVSPHLLDRFALRFSGTRFTMGNRVERLKARLSSPSDAFRMRQGKLNKLSRRIQQAAPRSLAFHRGVVQQALGKLATSNLPRPGMRRPISLLRLAHALTRLLGGTAVSTDQVNLAASLLGLTPSADRSTGYDQRQPTEPSEAGDVTSAPNEKPPPLTQTRSDIAASVAAPSRSQPAAEAQAAAGVGKAAVVRVAHKVNPFPEDRVTFEPETSSLRLPATWTKHGRARGVIIGVQPASGGQEIAISASILEAAKFQAARRKKRSTPHLGMVFEASDLRTYRRLAVTERLLILLLDYTSLKKCDWHRVLLPYLIEAYTHRAGVCVVQVGAKSAQNELQACKLTARNLLVPKVGAALGDTAGRATPLAHGLELALQVARQALLKGRSRAAEATLVVLTDGRGNVPLAWSTLGQFDPKDGPAKRRAFDDCLEAGRRLARMRGVRATLLVPNPHPLQRLPAELGQALAAQMQVIPTGSEQQAKAL